MKQPYIELNAHSTLPLILLGEHAGFCIPPHLQKLGVSPESFREDVNFAGDHGTRHILFYLARKLGATTIMGRYSRLLVDLNREMDDPQMFWEKHHGVTIPANIGLSETEKNSRIERYYDPFHCKVTSHIERLISLGRKPVLLTIHSYTPQIACGDSTEPNHEPLDIGLLYFKPSKFLESIDNSLRRSGLSFAHNKPYDLQEIKSGSIVTHQKAHDLDALALEINIDLLKDFSDQERMSVLLLNVIKDFVSTT